MLDKILGIIELVKCPTEWCIIWICYIDNLITQFFSLTPFLGEVLLLFTGVEAFLGGVFEAVADADFVIMLMMI
jgi:hypothetical protein